MIPPTTFHCNKPRRPLPFCSIIDRAISTGWKLSLKLKLSFTSFDAHANAQQKFTRRSKRVSAFCEYIYPIISACLPLETPTLHTLTACSTIEAPNFNWKYSSINIPWLSCRCQFIPNNFALGKNLNRYWTGQKWRVVVITTISLLHSCKAPTAHH